MKNQLQNIDIVILCGGLGTRLQSILLNQPKVLAKIGDTTFLDILLNKISIYGFKNIILCTGYLKEEIKKYVEYYYNNTNNYNITFSEEEIPLGTGGAIKNVKSLINNDNFIVMNGDSICNIDFNELYKFHIRNNALLTMILSKSNETKRTKDYGNVVIDEHCKITKFNEKNLSLPNTSLINAGIYLMRREIFYHMPKKETFSLEYDLFSKLGSCRFYGFVTDNEVIDIGTPERYKKAIDIFIKE